MCGIKPDQTEASFVDKNLKPADAQLLAFDLKFSSPLTSLDVRQNAIGDAGKLAIGKALLASESSKLHTMHCDEWSIDPSITELDLSRKQLKAADATFLAGIIKFNSPLTQLNLWANKIGAEGAKALAAVLPSR